MSCRGAKLPPRTIPPIAVSSVIFPMNQRPLILQLSAENRRLSERQTAQASILVVDQNLKNLKEPAIKTVEDESKSKLNKNNMT